MSVRDLVIAVAIGAGVPVVGLVLHAVFVSVIRRMHLRRPFSVSGLPLHLSHWFAPFRVLIPAAGLASVVHLLPVPEDVRAVVAHVALLGVVAGVAWVLASTLAVGRDLIVARQRLDAADNLRARRIYTQLRVIERIIEALIVVLTLATMLLTFPEVRQIGASLLASAGIVGVIAGFAAQRTLGTVFAGVQIALSQPIRLDDIVVVQGESGTIEEITLTYVVVHIWDHRRLVLPVTYFIEQPFQNWTRTTSDLLGTVFLYADYTLPVQPVRDEFQRFIEASPLWDRKAAGFQVTNATEHTLELRALVSAANSSDLWNLRCAVREHLVSFLQRSVPLALPRTRVELERPVASAVEPPQLPAQPDSRR